MDKIVRLKESDLIRITKKVLLEQPNSSDRRDEYKKTMEEIENLITDNGKHPFPRGYNLIRYVISLAREGKFNTAYLTDFLFNNLR